MMASLTDNRGVPQSLPCGEFELRNANDKEIRYKPYKKKEYDKNG